MDNVWEWKKRGGKETNLEMWRGEHVASNWEVEVNMCSCMRACVPACMVW